MEKFMWPSSFGELVMCLYNDIELAKKLRAGKKKLFTCYKIVWRNINKDGHYEYISLYFDHKWKSGINKSDAYLDSIENTIINNGIHTYSTRAEATFYNRYNSSNCVIIKVIGESQHIIGAGDNQLVFTQVKFDRPQVRPKSKRK